MDHPLPRRPARRPSSLRRLRFLPLAILALLSACKTSEDDLALPDAGGVDLEAGLDVQVDTSGFDAPVEATIEGSTDAPTDADADVSAEASPDADAAAADAPDDADAEPADADADLDVAPLDAPDEADAGELDASDAAPDSDLDAADASPFTVLASGQSSPAQLVLGGGAVYWLNQGAASISTVPTGGGTVTDVASPSTPAFIHADATNLYWATSSGEFYEQAHGAGSPQKLGAAAGVQPVAMTTDGTYLYWAGNSSHVQRLPLDGSGSVPEDVGPAITSPSGVAVASGALYVTGGLSTGDVDRIEPDGGLTTIVANSRLYNVSPARIITDGTYLFWIEDVYGSPSSVEGSLLDGTALAKYVGTASGIRIAADGTSLYYGSGFGDYTIVRFAAGDRFSAKTLYSHLPYASMTLAVDATSLYWADYTNGVIYKAPK